MDANDYLQVGITLKDLTPYPLCSGFDSVHYNMSLNPLMLSYLKIYRYQ